MDKETKHEIWIVALGTIIAEVPLVLIATMMIFTH
jgi:hypothetical protein